MRKLLRILRGLPLLLVSPLLVLGAAVALALTDLLWLVAGRKRPPGSHPVPGRRGASIVIPTWNGRELLERNLPSVLAATAGNPGHEIIVVDNGSADGTVEFLREHFPQVRTLALPENMGFGGGSNAGFRAAANDVVVLLNNDMRVEPGFVEPLLEGFTDGDVFAISCQIHFTDARRQREETGLTEGWWESGQLRVRHRVDQGVKDLYPCFYGGGGSCAFNRRLFLELGGFDALLEPFYLEDTDVGYRAWKRGWKVLYQPRSVVYHEHRGTIGRRFSAEQIQTVLKTNFLLFTWKNIHAWKRLAAHFGSVWGDGLVSLLFGDSPERASLAGLWRAFLRLHRTVPSRWRARALAAMDDTEAFARPRGGYFRDRFAEIGPSDPLRVLFVSPYPICPPVHGGGVFMKATVEQLARLCELHLIILLDHGEERAPHAELERLCASVEYMVRLTGQPKAFGSIVPHAVREFANADLRWLIHRQIATRAIDVVQLEYTPLGQYAERYLRLASVLFEHDVYFQSIARALQEPHRKLWKLKATLEYLRALRYELQLLPKVDRIHVCSRENGDYLVSFRPELAGKVEAGLRACVDASCYEFRPDGREPATMLFLGSFRHTPNQAALNWFAREVLPRVVATRPEARLVVVGSEPPPRYALPETPALELRGFVEDVREPLGRYAAFVCPILSGSGVRVKLLEAFAAGIPVVSTRIGAEGVAREDGEFCGLADDAAGFAERILALFNDPARARAMAERARREVIENWDAAVLTARLVDSYRAVLREKRSADAAHRTEQPEVAPHAEGGR
ncbi:MAG: glycosyltransferase [Acidobacteria bacterium]|nr:glycosyltransferase [Acidobacteriota bacterium]